MKAFCIRLCLITALLFVSHSLTSGLTPAEQNGLNEIPEAGHDASIELSLWRFMCPAHTGIGTIKNGAIIMVNDYVTRLLGYSRQELLGQGERLLYPDESEYARVNGELQKLNVRQEPLSVETRWKAKDGSLRDVHLYATPLEPGNPAAGIVFTVQDITERKQADHALRRRASGIQAAAVAVACVLAVLLFLIRRNLSRIQRSEQEL